MANEEEEPEEETDVDTDYEEGEEKETPESEQEDESDKGEDDGDEEVVISKSKLAQLEKDSVEKENYRKAVIRLNAKKGKALPSGDEEEEEEPKKKGEFVTREELNQREDKQAIAMACKDAEVSENWHDIIAFYVPPKEASLEAKSKAIEDAHLKWKSANPDKEVDEHKKISKDLASESGISKGKEKQPVAEKKHVLTKNEPIGKWYK